MDDGGKVETAKPLNDNEKSIKSKTKGTTAKVDKKNAPKPRTKVEKKIKKERSRPVSAAGAKIRARTKTPLRTTKGRIIRAPQRYQLEF